MERKSPKFKSLCCFAVALCFVAGMWVRFAPAHFPKMAVFLLVVSFQQQKKHNKSGLEFIFGVHVALGCTVVIQETNYSFAGNLASGCRISCSWFLRHKLPSENAHADSKFPETPQLRPKPEGPQAGFRICGWL